MKGRAVCKECYNQKYRNKNKAKRELIMKDNNDDQKTMDDYNKLVEEREKLIEEREKLIEEREKLIEENKLLKDKLVEFENDDAKGKKIDREEYERLVTKYEKLAECIKSIQILL